MAQWLWTQKQDIGPGPRSGHAMAYDSEHKACSALRGRNDDYARNSDTWAWDGQAWTQVADTGPTPRWGHGLTFGSVRQRTVLFGGYVGGVSNETWEWDGGVWTQVADTGPLRCSHGLTFDSVRRRVLLFGGWVAGNTNETWEWDGGVWTRWPTLARVHARNTP